MREKFDDSNDLLARPGTLTSFVALVSKWEYYVRPACASMGNYGAEDEIFLCSFANTRLWAKWAKGKNPKILTANLGWGFSSLHS